MKTINILSMSPEDTKDLFEFLSQQQASTKIWKANQIYKFGIDEITLSHDVIWRKRKENKSGNRYEVMTTNVIGQGSFGKVYDITGTLAEDATKIVFKQNKSRVVKLQDHSKANNPIRKLQNEYEITKIASHIRIKEPTVINDQSFTTMKKLKGTELFDIIDKDLGGDEVLTIEQRQQLSLALVKALKEQVTDKGIIHRDIKMENILVDLQNPITVNIIDFGLSILTTTTTTESGGTPNFAPPEAYEGRQPTIKFDVFSMARLLGLLWHDDTQHYTFDNNDFRMVRFASNVHYNDLFNNDKFQSLSGLSGVDKNLIKSTLEKMSLADCNSRLSIEDAINAFEKIQSTYQVTPVTTLPTGNLLFFPKPKSPELAKTPEQSVIETETLTTTATA